MRYFKDGETIWVEPWRAKPFPVIKDLIVDRSAFDKIQIAGGFISVNSGAAPEANSILVRKKKSDEAFNSAICIGCGACVAACKNASAMLFVSAKISQFALLPQGQIEAKDRVRAMVAKMDEVGFGNCSNTGSCEAECPKEIKLSNIARLNREFYKAF
jgi:succinate dehydrogenase / fumarate reductase iron-sulfur subunit